MDMDGKRSFLRNVNLFDELINPENATVQSDCCIEFNITGDAWWSNPINFNDIWTIAEDFLVCYRILKNKRGNHMQLIHQPFFIDNK